MADVVELRVERDRAPLRAAAQAGRDEDAVERRRRPHVLVGDERLDGGRHELFLRRGLFRILRYVDLLHLDQRLAGLAVEDVEPAGLARGSHGFHRLAADAGGEENRHRRLVVVPDVVADLLEGPAQLAGVGVQRNDRATVKVVAVTPLAVEVGVTWRLATSIVGFIHVPAPPTSKRNLPLIFLFGQLLLPGSFGAGIVYHCQSSLPVLASKA